MLYFLYNSVDEIQIHFLMLKLRSCRFRYLFALWLAIKWLAFSVNQRWLDFHAVSTNGAGSLFVRKKRKCPYVSGKLPTYPSPKPTFCPEWKVSVNVVCWGTKIKTELLLTLQKPEWQLTVFLVKEYFEKVLLEGSLVCYDEDICKKKNTNYYFKINKHRSLSRNGTMIFHKKVIYITASKNNHKKIFFCVRNLQSFKSLEITEYLYRYMFNFILMQVSEMTK